MPKYIDKEQLPQFKYYNFCEGREYGWNFFSGQDAEAYYKAVETNDLVGPVLNTTQYKEGEVDFLLANNDFFKLLNDDSPDVTNEIYDRWIKFTDNESQPGMILSFILVMLRAMHKDHHMVQHWEEQIKSQLSSISKDRYGLLLMLGMVDEYLSFALLLRSAQGYPIYQKNGDVEYPKMLLIEDVLYKKARETEGKSLHYQTIKRAMMDSCWIITINGESAEKKMIFVLQNAEDAVQIHMLDRKNGVSRFFLEKNVTEENGNMSGATISADAWHCHPRGDYRCSAVDDLCAYCDGQHNCKHKSLDIIASVLYCFQEYQKKLMTEQKVLPQKGSASKNAGKNVETFVPDGMMRLYDIKMSEEELRRTDKFAMYSKTRSEYPSTEKSPHVRRGTMRYNPKTGQKDIKVKGSIIHKDKYQGFASAERIKA